MKNKILILFLLLLIIVLFIGDYNLIIKENFTLVNRKINIQDNGNYNNKSINNLELLENSHKNHEMNIKRELENYKNMKETDCNEVQGDTLSSKGDKAAYNACNLNNVIKQRNKNFNF
jgi:hypothetical protein